jgi:hypothetical protein
MAEFRCYLLDGNRKVMATEVVRALTLPHAVTKGILAAVTRRAATFELWRDDRCIYVHQTAITPPPAAATSPTVRRDVLDE